MHTPKTLAFAQDFVEPVYAEEKQITLRKYREGAHDFTEGELVVGTFGGRGVALLRITADTECMPLGEVPDEVAEEDGFEGTADAYRGLLNYYTDITLESTIAIVRFELCEMPETGSAFFINF